MHSLVSSSFVIVVTCFLTTTCQPTAILRYVPVISYSTGLHLCVVDEPSSVSSLGVSSVLQCALMCMESSCCVMYQMNVTSKQCQLFDYLPRNYCNAPDCHSFCGISSCPGHHKHPTTETDEVFTVETRSFPFTVGGQLFYSCAADQATATGNAWCAAAQRLRNTCAPDDYGFVASNVTVTVKIPSATTSTLLRSVYGWLTILSRIDMSFPTGLSYVEYQNGFGDIMANYWLGLERTYLLTNAYVNGGQRYRLRFELLSSGNHRWYSEEYDWFYLDSSAANYTLRVSTSATGDAGDALNDKNNPSNGKQFAKDGTACVNLYSRWWYTAQVYCSKCRLFGDASGLGFKWGSIVNIVEMARMMIKLIDC